MLRNLLFRGLFCFHNLSRMWSPLCRNSSSKPRVRMERRPWGKNRTFTCDVCTHECYVNYCVPLSSRFINIRDAALICFVLEENIGQKVQYLVAVPRSTAFGSRIWELLQASSNHNLNCANGSLLTKWSSVKTSLLSLYLIRISAQTSQHRLNITFKYRSKWKWHLKILKHFVEYFSLIFSVLHT